MEIPFGQLISSILGPIPNDCYCFILELELHPSQNLRYTPLEVILN
jgi:hypothetical protein